MKMKNCEKKEKCVEVIEILGEPGSKGDTGPQGPQGPPGPILGNYLYSTGLRQNIANGGDFIEVIISDDGIRNGWLRPSTTQLTATTTGIYQISYSAYITNDGSTNGVNGGIAALLNNVIIPGTAICVNGLVPQAYEQVSKTFIVAINSGNIVTFKYGGTASGYGLSNYAAFIPIVVSEPFVVSIERIA